MQTIHKQQLAMSDIVKIQVPAGAKLLSAGTQDGKNICVWYEADTIVYEADTIATVLSTISIRICGTGHDLCRGMPEGTTLRFIGTVILCEGSLVFHVFEVEE